jgi:hydroxymethylpyrimidine kinase/phosphomethylpyrimidine kinase
MIQGLYLITPQGSDKKTLDVVRQGLLGGVKVVQYRDKERSDDAKVSLARQLVQLCKEAGATFLVNDSADLAVACFADGVHLGQDDGSVHDARKLLGANKLIGVSTRTVDQALKAEMAGADYIAVGSIFPTQTKNDAELVGLKTLSKVRRAVKIPLVAIGGINWMNAASALEAGADIGVDTIKTGMLYSAEIVSTVAELIQKHNLLAIVDPVMIAKGGAALLKQEAIEALRNQLLPNTYLLTPNIPEAEALTGKEIKTLEDMEDAAKALQAIGARHVLFKGGHRDGDAIDVLLAGTSIKRLTAERINTANTHGTGCSYSAALATFLAQGQPLVKAAASAKLFINEAIRHATPLGGGHGPINHFAGVKAVRKADREAT